MKKRVVFTESFFVFGASIHAKNSVNDGPLSPYQFLTISYDFLRFLMVSYDFLSIAYR